MSDRKFHVRIEQHYYLDYIEEYGPHCAADMAMVFNVSEATARRHLDGLVYQGKLELTRNHLALRNHWPYRVPAGPAHGSQDQQETS